MVACSGTVGVVVGGAAGGSVLVGVIVGVVYICVSVVGDSLCACV